MNNPFKAGDKVTTKVKGQPIKATVNQVWNEEVQVRTADKKLLWRMVKTVTLVSAAPAAEPAKEPAEAPEPAAANGKETDAKPSTSSVPYAAPSPSKKEVKSGPALSNKYPRTKARSPKRRKI